MTSVSTANWTVLRLLEWTTNYLRERGALTPRLDAEVLLAHCRRCSRIELYLAFEEEASEELRERFRDLVSRRANGTPVAYLVGSREFFSRNFRVTPDVLIPRPDSELIVTTLLDVVGPGDARHQSIRFADVGTGSGILAVTVCLELPQATGVATDISPAALAVARGNAETHQVVERLALLDADLFPDDPGSGSFDLVISNPPYVSESEYAQLDRGVRDFEPRISLCAGPRGTSIIERLVPRAASQLRPGGWLLFEISPMIERAACDLVLADGRYTEIGIVRDLARLPRVLKARRQTNS